jgi:hypothetical protein
MNSKLGSSHGVWNFTTTQFSRALLVLSVALIGLAEARAQQPTDQPAPPPPPATLLPGIEVLPTTYLWFPWTAVGVRPANTRFSNASSTIGPGDLYSHLTWVPFMGQAEFRNDQFGVITDFIHAPLKSGVTTRDILFGSGTGDFTLNTGSAVFLYRALALPNQNADVGLGFRAWGLDGSIALDPLRRRVPSVTIANGLSWADPLIAARYHYDFGNGFAATAYGDLGGFGVGAHFDWQLLGTIDYALRPGLDLHAGFRSLNFSYGAPRANINMNMNGPIISATFRF